jgi:glycosyltransferase involved in cell wall biosynthesis
LVKKLKIDLIHSHMYRANVPATMLKVMNPRLKVIGHYHNVNTWETPRQEKLDRYLAARRDMNVAVSEAVRRDVQNRLGIPERLTTTLYNCVDLDEFQPLDEPERNRVRETLGLESHHRVVTCVARLVKQKNQQLVLRSAPELLQAEPNTRFVFAGAGPDEQMLRGLADDLNISERVNFLGRRDDVAQILGSSDVAVLPSLKEGFSNAILEAMACGVPMVASHVGGNAEVVDHGTNGFLCDVAQNPTTNELEVNQAQFVRHVRRLLLEEDFRQRVAQTALERAQHYGIDAMVREIEELYLEVLEG